MILKYIVAQTDKFNNLKDLLKNYFQISERLLVKLKHEQKIFVNINKAFVDMQIKKRRYYMYSY